MERVVLISLHSISFGMAACQFGLAGRISRGGLRTLTHKDVHLAQRLDELQPLAHSGP